MQKQVRFLFIAALVLGILFVFIIISQPSCTLQLTGSWSRPEVNIEWSSK